MACTRYRQLPPTLSLRHLPVARVFLGIWQMTRWLRKQLHPLYPCLGDEVAITRDLIGDAGPHRRCGGAWRPGLCRSPRIRVRSLSWNSGCCRLSIDTVARRSTISGGVPAGASTCRGTFRTRSRQSPAPAWSAHRAASARTVSFRHVVPALRERLCLRAYRNVSEAG